ncbi:MAG TPA: hypothetical protein VHA79_12075 [Mycobacteriales bacterium]|nr:hypothetical protein [Mycobacteriales bacterium]
MSASRSLKVLGITVVVGLLAALPFVLRHADSKGATLRTLSTAADPTPSSDASTSAVEQAFEQAMVQHQHSGVLTPPEISQLTNLTSLTKTAAAALRTNILKQVQTRDLALTRKYFTGSQYNKERWSLNRAIKAERTGLIVADGGVTNVDYSSVVVDGKSATVTAAVTVYSELRPLNQPAATPSNVLLATATMQKDILGRWRMSKLDWTFEPGTGP